MDKYVCSLTRKRQSQSTLCPSEVHQWQAEQFIQSASRLFSCIHYWVQHWLKSTLQFGQNRKKLLERGENCWVRSIPSSWLVYVFSYSVSPVLCSHLSPNTQRVISVHQRSLLTLFCTALRQKSRDWLIHSLQPNCGNHKSVIDQILHPGPFSCT